MAGWAHARHPAPRSAAHASMPDAADAFGFPPNRCRSRRARLVVVLSRGRGARHGGSAESEQAETRRALAFGRLSADDAVVFVVGPKEADRAVRSARGKIGIQKLMPHRAAAAWFVLKLHRPFVREGQAASSSASHHRSCAACRRGIAQRVMTEMVEQWGHWADRGFDLLTKVTEPHDGAAQPATPERSTLEASRRDCGC